MGKVDSLASPGPRRTWRAGWLFLPITLVILGLVVAATSCSGESAGYAPPSGQPNETQQNCIGETCPQSCAEKPRPGCTCDVEGQHLACSKAEATFSDGTTVCGQGISVCTDGVWGDCTLNSSVTIVPNPPPGFYAEGLGAGSSCTSNPCNPGCIDFVDTPGGAPIDAGVSTSDAGVTLTGDGGSVCVPKTCLDLGKTCGPAGDGCGGLLQCGTCISPATCGGGGVPSVCGVPASCTNLCLLQQVCANNGTTSITGKVYAPNGTTPIPNALVYVPNGSVKAFSAGVACVTSTNCTEASGSPLVSTTTAVDGSFTLNNMPVGLNIPVVIQVGRFRRQITIPSVAPCVNTDTTKLSTSSSCKANGKTCSKASDCCSLSCSKTNGANPVCDPLTRLPKNQNEGDIPKMAFVTGQVDGLECVWRKVGIDDTEFTAPSGTGRINFFAGSYAAGTYVGTLGTTTPYEDSLVGSPSTLSNYDMVLFPCQGGQNTWGSPTQANYETNIANYVNAGGRVFTTHYSYIWLYSDASDVGGACKTNGSSCSSNSDCCSLSCSKKKCVSTYSSPLSSAINWGINQSNPTPDPGTGYINTSFSKGLLLAQWLQAVGASTTQGQISINTLRHDFNSVVSPSTLWMTVGSTSGVPMEATFNTPLGVAASQQCGRVVHSDFHVENASNTQVTFPGECPSGSMTPQELLLTDMLFDLASCVTADTPVTCTPVTCSSQGLNCGPAGDGCGNQINCGTCTLPNTCGGGGTPGVCGTPKVYSDAYFSRDYDASNMCAQGFHPVWRLYSWSAVTPTTSHIDFTIQTATTAAGLTTATSKPLLFSNPPGPTALVGQAATAHAANVPLGSPDTQIAAASPDYALKQGKLAQSNGFVRVTAHLVPSVDLLRSPTLTSWDMQIDCVDNQ